MTVDALPILTCQANGGDPHRAAPVAAAWQWIRLAAKLLDEVEDGKGNGYPAMAVHIAIGLLTAAPLALGELAVQKVSPDRIRRLVQELQHAVLRACAGQHADLMASLSGRADVDPDTWLEIAAAKSGALLAWAAWAGALVAGAEGSTLAGYQAYGHHLGVLLQVADDFRDVWQPDGAGDLATGSLTLPVCYARLVAQGEERDRLERLLRRAVQGDDAAETQAQQMLIDLGAQGYLLAVARVQQRQAMAALQRANPAPPAGEALVALLERVFPGLRIGAQAGEKGRNAGGESHSQPCGEPTGDR